MEPRRDELAEALEKLRPGLQQKANTIFADENDAEDLVQNVISGAYVRCHGRDAVRYVERVVHCQLIQELMVVRYRRMRVDIDPDKISASEEPQTDTRGCEATMEDIVVAVQQLSPTLRSVFEMYEMERMAYREVAARLGISVTAVASRLYRARRQLKESLARNWQSRHEPLARGQ